MNDMQMWEAETILDQLQYYDAPSWERCRILLHGQVSAFSKNKLELKDIMTFPWDEKTKSDLPTEITNEDIARLRKQANSLRTSNRATVSNDDLFNEF